MSKTVYILGAGCSAGTPPLCPGYPLASEFNYDRLFEIAFISRFKPDTGLQNLYGKSLLNSGLDYVAGPAIDVESGRFAFLKLHGSVGIRVRNEAYADGPEHYTRYDGLPGVQTKPINDEVVFANDSNLEPLIVFPHEKPFVADGTETLLPFRTYIQGVWKHPQARLAGRALLSVALTRFDSTTNAWGDQGHRLFRCPSPAVYYSAGQCEPL